MAWLGTTIGKIVAAAIVLLLVLGLFQVRACHADSQRAAQGKVDRGQAGAARESAGDAINSVSDVAANQAASEELTRTNAEEIRNAEGADQPVHPDAHAAGLRALCRRAAYRDHPRCRVLQPAAR